MATAPPSRAPADDLAPGRSSGATITPSGAAPAPEPKPVLPALREIVTAAIGLGIVLVTLALAWRLFSLSGVPPQMTVAVAGGPAPERFDPFQRGKDVLLLLLPLAGAIVGYYTGRVIADRTIDQANQTARTATDAATQAQTTAASAKNEAAQAQQAKQDVKGKAEKLAELALRGPAHDTRRSAGFESLGRSEIGGAPEPDTAEEVRRLLREIRDR